jgi:hypothetical protein
MIFSENRYTLFWIMLWDFGTIVAVSRLTPPRSSPEWAPTSP